MNLKFGRPAIAVTSFPLTPALSLRERGNRWPVFGGSEALGLAESLDKVLPLPWGEGRGEGEGIVAVSADAVSSPTFMRSGKRASLRWTHDISL
jgi:hypothetical protein